MAQLSRELRPETSPEDAEANETLLEPECERSPRTPPASRCQPERSPGDGEGEEKSLEEESAYLFDPLLPLDALVWTVSATISATGLTSCMVGSPAGEEPTPAAEEALAAKGCPSVREPSVREPPAKPGEPSARRRRPPHFLLRGPRQPPPEPPPTRPGTLGNLTPHQERQLAQLEELLAADPPPVVAAHAREGRKRRLVRFLRADSFDPEVAFSRIHEHARWWLDYGMDTIADADEFDESGIVYACGEDRFGQPVLIARPAMHSSSSTEESLAAVRRCVFTMQRCVERLPPGREQISMIYDCMGARAWNWDLTFSQELLRIFSRHFPERMFRVVVINSGWLVSTLWVTVSTLMDPASREKIRFCNSDFKDELLSLVREDHPYLRYALKVQTLGGSEDVEIPMPRATRYLPRWCEAVAADENDASRDQPELAEAAEPGEAAERGRAVEPSRPAEQGRAGRPRMARLAGVFLRGACCRST